MSHLKSASALGMNSASISNYKGGKRLSDSAYLSKICEHFQVNLNWHLTSEGPMFQELVAAELNMADTLRLPVVAELVGRGPAVHARGARWTPGWGR